MAGFVGRTLERMSGLRPILLLASLASLLAACSGNSPSGQSAPARSNEGVPVPSESSLIAAPVDFDARILLRAVERTVPRTLWTINERYDRCVPRKSVKVLGRNINVVPKIGCTVVGKVTRGAIRMRGEGRDIVFDVPLRASLRARDVGGILREENATGSAMVQARIQLELGQDWTTRGTVKLRYNWTRPPGIDFLGRRITFTKHADRHLRPIMRRLESDLPRELAKFKLRPTVERAWDAAFTTLPLNASDPAVWMRLTPQKPIFNGYSVKGNRIQLKLGLETLTETFVGVRPSDPQPSSLPAPAKSDGNDRLQFFIPVVADYSELEAVIQRALDKRARWPFDLPGVGETDAKFTDITAYGTTGGRIAVGMDIAAIPRSDVLGETAGRVWLQALPVNSDNSMEVEFKYLKVTGDIEGVAGELLLKLANSQSVTSAITEALGQNFSSDAEDLLAKIRLAIAEQRPDNFVIRSSIDEVETGRLQPFGEGLYLPVRATGKATIEHRPGR